MGSDRAPYPEVQGALRAARELDLEIELVGDRARLEAELAVAGRTSGDRVSIVQAAARCRAPGDRHRTARAIQIGGALLAGVTKPVVIAHGRSDANAMVSAIRAAARFAERRLPDALAAALA